MVNMAPEKVQVGQTSKFSVLDVKGSKVKHAKPEADAVVADGEQTIVIAIVYILVERREIISTCRHCYPGEKYICV